MIVNLNLPGSDIQYYENFLENDESKDIFDYLNNLDGWEKKKIKVFGKECYQNRETVVFSEKGLNYKYSGIDNVGFDIHSHGILIKIKNKIERFFNNQYTFNYILCNRYKTGRENIGMHSDDEKNLFGPIVSISLGVSRFFDITGKPNTIGNSLKKRIELKNGSMLIMSGQTQTNYKHGIPKQNKISETRINLTYRIIRNGK